MKQDEQSQKDNKSRDPRHQGSEENQQRDPNRERRHQEQHEQDKYNRS